MHRRATKIWLPYLVSALAIVLASVVGALLRPALGDNVLYFTYFAAVTFSAWYGGLGPALIATVLSYVIANVYFIGQNRAFVFDVAAFTYLFVCVAIAAFSEAMKRALRRAETNAAEIISIVENISDGFIAIDRNFHCTFMNRAAEELARRYRQHLPGGAQTEAFPFMLEGAAGVKLKQGLGEGVTVEFENFYEPWQRWFEVKASPAEAGGLAIHFRDISERKSAELALAESEERLRLAQHGAKAGLWDWDLITGRLTWSEQYYEICGLDRATTPSYEHLLDSVHPEDRPEVARAIQATLKAGAPLDVQYRIAHPKHGPRWIAGLGRTLADNAGRAVRMSGIALDITDRKKAEENLRFFSDSGTGLSAVLDLESTMRAIARLAVPFLSDWCVVTLIGPLGEVERSAHAHRDRAHEAVLDELIEQHPFARNVSSAVVRDGRCEFLRDVTQSYLNSLARDDAQRRLLESIRPASLIVVPLLVRDKVIGTLCLFRVDSGRRYAQADVDLATEFARRAAVAIDNARLYRDLQDAQQQKDDFLAMLAHELRNPLAAILYANEMLKITNTDENPAAEIIDRQLSNLSHLIDDLLDVSRITQDKIQLKKEYISGATIVRRAIGTAQPLIEGRRHQLSSEISDEPMPLFVDAVRAEQILVNLLTNAAKYTGEGGRITVRCYPQDGNAIFKIQDTGIGIPTDMLPRVFELFTQVEQSLDRSQGGLGIGLTVVRKLVEMHGGRVSVKSDGLGCGSEFTVGLPLSHMPTEEVPAKPPIDTALAAQKILVVDDNVDTAKSISSLLKKKGYTAAMAHDGLSAMEVARSFGPDVVLLDLGLPGVDGYRVAKTLREEDAFANVRFIALSGYGQPADRQRSQEAGFNEHLVKPVSFNTLLSVLAGR